MREGGGIMELLYKGTGGEIRTLYFSLHRWGGSLTAPSATLGRRVFELHCRRCKGYVAS